MNNTQIANRMHCSRNTVKRWIDCCNHTMTVSESYERKGRKRKLTEDEEQRIVEFTKKVKFTTPKQIIRVLQLRNISYRTIDRLLIRNDLWGRVARTRHPKMDPKKRLSFANGYLDFNWCSVMFSDECCIWFNRHTRTWVRRPRGTKYAVRDEYTQKSSHHGEKINIIGFISCNGVGKLETFTKNMDGKLLKKLFKNNVIQSAKQFFTDNTGEMREWWLLHDNDKKFHTHLVKQWCFNNGVALIDFPTYSPDLNPIENIWAYLKHAITLRNAEIKDVKDLIRIIHEEWLRIPTIYCWNACLSMKRRCLQVIANNGFKSNY